MTHKEIPIMLNELFLDNRNGWLVGEDELNEMRIDNGKYFLERKINQSWSMSGKEIFLDPTRDFRIETKINFLHGPNDYGYGLVWGWNPDNANLHLFQISSSGEFSIGYDYKNNYSKVKSWQKCEFINNGMGTNLLKVEKIGDDITFYINNVPVFETFFTKLFGNGIGLIIDHAMKISVEFFKVSGYIRALTEINGYENSTRNEFENQKKIIASQNNLSGYEWHFSDKYGIIIELPEMWIIKEDSMEGVGFIAFSPVVNERSTFQENINIIKVSVPEIDDSMDTEAFFEAMIQEYNVLVPEFQFISCEPLQIGQFAVDGFQLNYFAQIDGQKVKNTLYHYIDTLNKYSVTIHCNAKITESDIYYPIFLRIIGNLAIYNY